MILGDQALQAGEQIRIIERRKPGGGGRIGGLVGGFAEVGHIQDNEVAGAVRRQALNEAEFVTDSLGYVGNRLGFVSGVFWDRVQQVVGSDRQRIERVGQRVRIIEQASAPP